MSLFIDVNKFIEYEEDGAYRDSEPLHPNTLALIKKKREQIKHRKGIYSENDSLGKEIAGGTFGDLASAHFSRWMRYTYKDEIGDCDC